MNYEYDLDVGHGETLTTPGVLSPEGAGGVITYGDDVLPTFSLPPSSLERSDGMIPPGLISEAGIDEKPFPMTTYQCRWMSIPSISTRRSRLFSPEGSRPAAS